MKTIIYEADSRGTADHGWLQTHHSFSFAHYYDPERMGFGVLRVLNDDVIQGHNGFGMHPHDNMEIITIPLEGALEHKDSMGNVGVVAVREDSVDVQVMSAGTGIVHSEYNKNTDIPVKLLQIWIAPNEIGLKPRYEQIAVTLTSGHNKLQQIVSPEGADAPLWIHQNVWLYLGKFDARTEVTYAPKLPGNGLYIFVIEGNVRVNDIELFARDAVGISSGISSLSGEHISITVESSSYFLLIDVPMK